MPPGAQARWSTAAAVDFAAFIANGVFVFSILLLALDFAARPHVRPLFLVSCLLSLAISCPTLLAQRRLHAAPAAGRRRSPSA